MDGACNTYRERSTFRVLVEKPPRKGPLENLSVDGRIILKWILIKSVRRTCTGLKWLRIWARCGFLRKRQILSTKFGGFLD
jgi:hypothetical protein